MSVLRTIRFASQTSRLGAISHWPPARVDRLQRQRLRRLVRFAIAKSPFYRDKYRGIDLSRLTLDQLPTTNKLEIAAHFDDVVTDRRVRRTDIEHFVADMRNLGTWFRGKYAVSRTSGSQGPPLLIVQNRRAIEILFAIMSSRANATGRPTPLEGLRRLRNPVKVAIVATQQGFYPSGAAFEFMSELVGRFVRVERLASQQPDLFQRLNEFQPNVLVSYASILDALAHRLDRLRLTELRQIGSSSEQLTASIRGRIEAAFGVPVLDHYATGECLFLSEGCATDGGAHINSDCSILEVVDEDHRAVPPGALGKKVLITNLANYVQPFLRYEVDDRVALATRPCRCGSRFPRIERIEGRLGDLFWTRDAQGFRMLSGVFFHAAADAIPEIRAWQAVQRERNNIDIALQLLPDTSLSATTARQALVAKLKDLGLPPGVTVDVRIVGSLPPDPTTGKLRRMISKVGPPEQSAFTPIQMQPTWGRDMVSN
jgi:phenylacetate-CoA ligase